jgi:hypothetical protein
MIAFLQNRGGVGDQLVAGPYATPALVPSSPWLQDSVPLAPRVTAVVDTLSGRTTLALVPEGASPVRSWVVRARFGEAWTTNIVPGSVREHSFAAADASARPDLIVVTAVGRTGVESGETRVVPAARP